MLSPILVAATADVHESADTQQCVGRCAQVLPLDAFRYVERNGRRPRWRTSCRVCENAENRGRRQRKGTASRPTVMSVTALTNPPAGPRPTPTRSPAAPQPRPDYDDMTPFEAAVMRIVGPSDSRPWRWEDDAACLTVDPEVFFPELGDNGTAAKRICNGQPAIDDRPAVPACPVREFCLRAHLHEPYGIFGGKSNHQRRAAIAGRTLDDAADDGEAA